MSVPRASDTEIKLMQLQVSEALVKLGDDENVQSIRAALYPSRPEELEATALAVQILGQVRDKGSSGAMIHLAETKDAAGRPLPAEIRLGIAAALAKLGSPQGGFIADEFVAIVAAEAYKDIKAYENDDSLSQEDKMRNINALRNIVNELEEKLRNLRYRV